MLRQMYTAGIIGVTVSFISMSVYLLFSWRKKKFMQKQRKNLALVSEYREKQKKTLKESQIEEPLEEPPTTPLYAHSSLSKHYERKNNRGSDTLSINVEL